MINLMKKEKNCPKKKTRSVLSIIGSKMYTLGTIVLALNDMLKMNMNLSVVFT